MSPNKTESETICVYTEAGDFCGWIEEADAHMKVVNHEATVINKPGKGMRAIRLIPDTRDSKPLSGDSLAQALASYTARQKYTYDEKLPDVCATIVMLKKFRERRGDFVRW